MVSAARGILLRTNGVTTMKTNAFVFAVLAALTIPTFAHAGVLKDTGRLLGDEVQKHEDRQDLRQDKRDRRQDTKEFVKDLTHGNVGGAIQDLGDIHQDNREIRQDKRDLHEDRRDIRQDKRSLENDFWADRLRPSPGTGGSSSISLKTKSGCLPKRPDFTPPNVA